MLNWDTTREEMDLIRDIVKRARALLNTDFIDLAMDITACHLNGCPLDLAGLLAARDADFGHDVLGINRHINRETGQLEDCFCPRHAVQVPTFTTAEQAAMDRGYTRNERLAESGRQFGIYPQAISEEPRQ